MTITKKLTQRQHFLARGTCQLLAMNVNRRFLRTRSVGLFAVVFFRGIALLIL